jgi:S-formylglutathione hydrolase FrmB
MPDIYIGIRYISPVADTSEAGNISRRAVLGGLVGSIVVLSAGAGAGDYELRRHPGMRYRVLHGCGSPPAIPHSDYTNTTGVMASAAMRGASIPWSVALPRTHPRSVPLPLVLALPGENGNEHLFSTDVGLPGYATAAGLPLAFASFGDVTSSYYHPRSDGTDYLAFIATELIPMVERRFGVGGSRGLRASYGWSMGGFGSLLLAQQHPDLVCAAVGASPAVFPSYDAAVTGHPHTFDSPADWERWGLWETTSSMGAVPVRIDCGEGDPFVTTARALLDRIPRAVGAISGGCHNAAFWRTNATRQLTFLAGHLTG